MNPNEKRDDESHNSNMTTEPAQVAFSRCVDAACEVWHITPEAITSQRRSMWEVVPRFACYRYLRELGFSYTTIRDVMERKDHGAVMNGCAKFADMLETDPKIRRQWEQFKLIIQQNP